MPVLQRFLDDVAPAFARATMDGAGILYSNKDPMQMAALINAIVGDQQLCDSIVEGQYAALDRLDDRLDDSTRRGDPGRTRPTTPRVSRVVAARPAPVSRPARRPSSSRSWPSCARSSSPRGRS